MMVPLGLVIVVGLAQSQPPAPPMAPPPQPARTPRHNRRFRKPPSFAGHYLEWKAERRIGLAGLNTTWVPPVQELMTQPLVRERKRFAKDLNTFQRVRGAVQCADCGAAPAVVRRDRCVGLGSLLVGVAQASAEGLEQGKRSVYAPDVSEFRRRGEPPGAWFTKDGSRKCDRLFGCYLPRLRATCEQASCDALQRDDPAIIRNVGARPRVPGARPRETPGRRTTPQALRGDALRAAPRRRRAPAGAAGPAVARLRPRARAPRRRCLNKHRTCRARPFVAFASHRDVPGHADRAYVDAARRLKDAYGFRELRVVSDSAALPLAAWAADFETVTVLSSFDRNKYDVAAEASLTSKELRAQFPERRMAAGELGNATAEALGDLAGARSLECASSTRTPRRPRCSAGGADELERATKARHRAAQLEFAALQLRRSHKQPPLCASKLLGRAGVLLVSGADEGAAAATVFFTYVVNHALYADHHRLLPWVNLGWLEVPRVYDPKVHLQGTNGASSLFFYGFLRSAPGAGIWSHYFEPLENVALYEAHRSGRLASAPDDVDAGRAEAPRNCRDGNVVSKSLEWRHTIHRKALWAARAWYYGPKKRHALPLDLSRYEERWFAKHRGRAHGALAAYVRFLRDGAATARAPAILGAVERGDLAAAGLRASPRRRGRPRPARSSSASTRGARTPRTGAPSRPWTSTCPTWRPSRRGPGAVVYVATDDEAVADDPRWAALGCHVVAPTALRSTGAVAVFDAHAHRHHETNVEVLADILVLAHADVFVHAASAVAEAAQWLAFPRLHNRSVHLEFAPESQPHDAPGFAALAAATAPMARWAPPGRGETMFGSGMFTAMQKAKAGRAKVESAEDKLEASRKARAAEAAAGREKIKAQRELRERVAAAEKQALAEEAARVRDEAARAARAAAEARDLRRAGGARDPATAR
ncbi:glycolipid 2-alpha-mannosyltransferase [Aureococcus anophagefferens]|nr:glycolipid 2-alpha-mannosyltransferase [Aureococcus anophagefferens]